MSMKSKFIELLHMGALAETMVANMAKEVNTLGDSANELGAALNKQVAIFPRMDRTMPKNWHKQRRSRRKMQKASRKANRHA